MVYFKKKNRTILDMVQNILKNKNMPKEFWVGVADYVLYLSNYSPN